MELQPGPRQRYEKDLRMKKFYRLLAAFALAHFGASATAFGVGVWAYQKRNSIADFALVLFFTEVPAMVVSLFAGALVDRLDKRRVLLLGYAVSACCALILSVLAGFGLLQMWHIYLLLAIVSLAKSFVGPAFTASVAFFVSKDDMGRATGLIQTVESLSSVVAPAFAGFFLALLGLHGLLLAELVLFLGCVALFFGLPSPTRMLSANAEVPETRAIVNEILDGWRFILARPPLLILLALFGFINLVTCFMLTLIPPFILGQWSETTLGIVNSLSTCGLLAGSILAVAWKIEDKHRSKVIVLATIIGGFGILLSGFSQSIILIVLGFSVNLFSLGVLGAVSRAIWLTQVPQALQGRVYSTRTLVSQCVAPLAYLTAAPLANGVFEPLLIAWRTTLPSIGLLFGSEPGRGLALLFVCFGLLRIAVGLFLWFSKTFRLLHTA
jgi:DHA3 family macrolide efflux protein-like MFS transporter